MSGVVYTGFGIGLTGPLCDCQEESLGWSLTGSLSEPGIRMFCRTCSMELRVPHSELKAAFFLGEPYPGLPDTIYAAPGVIKAPPEGKLIQFRVDTPSKQEA